MSTMEHLFMQIFSRKRSIEDQFKHQVDSYRENIASNLLSEGLRPPPWLWISRSLCPNPRELNREQLISEILDQHPRATTPAKSNIYIVQDLKKTNVNLFSNFTFPEQDALSKFCGVKNRDECGSKDVPESSVQNSETRVEVEFMEKHFPHSSESHNDTNNRCSKRAKTLDNLFEENNFPEFTGRVTRSMSAGKKSSCVNRNNSVRRSRSQGLKCQSLDPLSIITESQGVANIARDGSEVNECILDGLTAYTAEDGCQLTNTLSSRLSAISLLPGPDTHFAEIIECDESPVSKFDQENVKNAEILHNSRTISRIEESHIDSAKEQVDGFVEIANPPSSVRTPCKSSEKTPASDRNVDECHADSKEAISNFGITNKSESEPMVERKELYSNGNQIADSDIFCNVFNHNGDESAYTSETNVQVIGSNSNISLPLTDRLHGTGYDPSPSIGNMLNSFKYFTVHPTLVQNVVMEGSDGEKSTGLVANEVIEVHVRDKSTDPSAEKDAERSSSLSILSRNDFRSRNMNSEEKIALKEMGLVEEKITPDAKKDCKAVQTRYLLRSSTSHDKQHSASTFSVITDSCNLKESVEEGQDNTWPKQKRNKNQFINVLHTSPRLKVETHRHSKPVNCAGKKSSDYMPGAIFESQSTMASQNTEVELPKAESGNLVRIKGINMKRQTSEGEQESMRKYHASDEDQKVNIGEECFSINADCNVLNFGKYSSGKVGNNSPFKLGEYEEQHGSSTLSGITKSCYMKESMDEGHANTWPERKRNRSQFDNVLGTSPWSRVETHKHKKPVNSTGKKSSDNISGAIFVTQPAMASQNTEVELPEAASGSQFRVEQISKKPRISEGEQELRGKYRASDEDQEVNIGEEYFSLITDCNNPNLDKCSLEKVIKNNPSKLGKHEESMIKSQAQGREGSSHNVDGSSMFSEHHENVMGNLDENLPDEGFAIDIAPIIADGIITTDSKISTLSEERASLLEQLCKSGSTLTIESCPLDDDIHNITDVRQFSLADVLEQTNLSCHDNWSDKDQPSTSKNVRTTEKFPSTPPIETLQQRKIRKSFASGDVSNPDYVCFRIDENSSVSQEETTSDHAMNSNEVCRSPNIAALADVTSKYQNIMPNTDSVSRKYSERETFDSVKPKSRLKADSKENINLEGKLSHVTNRTSSLQRMSSAKTTNRNMVKSSFEKLSKPNNIVSNISSFIPLVKEKQQTTTQALGKRDIKVKALEAAETAKRLEEKKQQEREMKKAAAKLERMRLEQENIRQLEVKQKQKEELRKKKEADIEAKKRQRVVEKAEQERKRRCTEETRKHKRANEKNIQDKNEDVKKRKRKEISKGVRKLTKSENGMKAAACTVSRETTSVVSKAEYDDLTHVINSVNTHGVPPQVKAVDYSYKLQSPIQDRMSVTAENREMSYEISPYKDSDDEDGDDDYARRKKFVPSWARKESINSNILSNCHLNPTAVFSRKRSFDIIKVLAPQVNKRPLP